MKSTRTKIEAWVVLDLNEKGSLWHRINPVDGFYETKKEAEEEIDRASEPNRWKAVKIKVELMEP